MTAPDNVTRSSHPCLWDDGNAVGTDRGSLPPRKRRNVEAQAQKAARLVSDESPPAWIVGTDRGSLPPRKRGDVETIAKKSSSAAPTPLSPLSQAYEGECQFHTTNRPLRLYTMKCLCWLDLVQPTVGECESSSLLQLLTRLAETKQAVRAVLASEELEPLCGTSGEHDPRDPAEPGAPVPVRAELLAWLVRAGAKKAGIRQLLAEVQERRLVYDHYAQKLERLGQQTKHQQINQQEWLRRCTPNPSSSSTSRRGSLSASTSRSRRARTVEQAERLMRNQIKLQHAKDQYEGLSIRLEGQLQGVCDDPVARACMHIHRQQQRG